MHSVSRQAIRNLPGKAGTRQDVFTLEEGEAVLQWPEVLSPVSLKDFEDWLQLVLRKVRRSVRDESQRE